MREKYVPQVGDVVKSKINPFQIQYKVVKVFKTTVWVTVLSSPFNCECKHEFVYKGKRHYIFTLISRED